MPTTAQQWPNNMEQRHNIATIVETRAGVAGMEVRAKDDGTKMLRGYALKWGQRYDLGYFTEEIARGALDGADMSDVRALYNHDPNFVLGRTAAGTLRLKSDEIGLMYEIDLPDTQAARDLAISVERGDISQSSWAFIINDEDDDEYEDNDMRKRGRGEKWEDGYKKRTVTRVKRVFDVSPVTYPANPDTTVAKRTIDAAKQEQEQIKLLNQRAAEIQRLRAKLF